jgi:hypothetical protein
MQLDRAIEVDVELLLYNIAAGHIAGDAGVAMKIGTAGASFRVIVCVIIGHAPIVIRDGIQSN